MNTPLHRACLGLSVLVLVINSGAAAPRAGDGKVEMLRDTWGIPHVFSDTDTGAMYGLGYATAQERAFQMTYSLRIVQGRLAEVIGERTRGGRRETSVDHDRQMRTFGWAHAICSPGATVPIPVQASRSRPSPARGGSMTRRPSCSAAT